MYLILKHFNIFQAFVLLKNQTIQHLLTLNYMLNQNSNFQ